MKRLSYQTKLYDYPSMKECARHICKMERKGWKTKVWKIDDTGCVWHCRENEQAEYPYSAEFYKEL